MTCEACRNAWATAGPFEKALKLHEAFPGGECEQCSLCSEAHTSIANDERLARILTTPGGYSNGDLLTQKLTSASSSGVSVIRSGASDMEILSTIENLLMNQAEPQELVGAALFAAATVRSLGEAEAWFRIYHTPDDAKTHHADILATTPTGSKSQQRSASSRRRAALKEALTLGLILESKPDGLLKELRSKGL